MYFREHGMDFREADRRYAELKRLLDAGSIRRMVLPFRGRLDPGHAAGLPAAVPNLARGRHPGAPRSAIRAKRAEHAVLLG
jgi:hypothetical protein